MLSGFGSLIYNIHDKVAAEVVIPAPTARARVERDLRMNCVRDGANRISPLLAAPTARLSI